MFFLTFLLAAMISGTSTSTNMYSLRRNIEGSNIKNLMMAIIDRNIAKVKELLNIVDIDSKDQYGLNVLHRAVYSNGEITRLLISHGADKVINDYAQYGISSPLFHACSYMSQYECPHMYEIIEAMLKAGADPNVSNVELLTPLHIIQTGREARLLISYGANVNAKDLYGYTPMFKCFSTDYHRINHEVLYALAEGNADFSITSDFGSTIFHMKSEPNALLWTKETVMFLARNGVPLDALNDNGETALTEYLKRDIRLNYWQFISQRILHDSLKDSFYAHMAEAGANLSAPNKRGETLLHIAVLKYHAGLAKWLLENGANVEAKNADGDPPLLALAKQEKCNYEISNFSSPCRNKSAGVRDVIEVFVEAGADVNYKDEGGRNAAYYLRKSRLTRMDSYIKNWLKKDIAKKRKLKK